MILPLGLGHKHIRTSYVSWLFFISFAAAFYDSRILEPHVLHLLLSFFLVLSSAPFVEMRMGTFLTLVGTLLTGLITGKGVVSTNPAYFEPFIAASWLTGTYFSLFFYRNSRIGLWRIFDWKYFKIETSIFTPILFVFLWWGFIFTGPFNKSFLIENLFPVASFLFGAGVGYLFKQKRPIPMGFLYEFEWKRWRSLTKRNVDLKKMANVAQVILDFNPENLKVQYDICKKIANEFKNDAWNDKNLNHFFNKQLSSLLEHLYKEHRIDSGIELLLTLPVRNAFQKVFVQISSQNLLNYAKAAEKKHLDVLAITLYSAFVEKNPKSSKNEEALRCIDYLLEREMELQNNIDVLQFLEANIVVPELGHLFKQHFQFSRTAVVTAIRRKSS